MTKDKIIETLCNNAKEYISGYGFVLPKKGLAKLADELLALIEQEKKEAIKDILTRLNITIEAETRPYIEAGTANYDKPIRALCVERIELDNKIENLAEEYGVEL